MLREKAAQIRFSTLMSMYKGGVGNVGRCMSVIEMLVALYYGDLNGASLMNVNCKKPGSKEQDYLILSKVCAAPVLYSILADLKFFDGRELDYLGQENSLLKKYPAAKVPGVCATLISEGQGLSVAVGLALNLKMDRKKNRIFAILGDDELQNGQIWEACSTAAYYNLDNLIAFVDNPFIDVDTSAISSIRTNQIQHKFEAFGWEVVQVMDGHNFDQLLDAVSKAFKSNRKPVCIWCHTIAGNGIEFAERKANYLKAVLSGNEMSEIIHKYKELV